MDQVVVISPEDELYPQERLTVWFPTLLTLHTLGNLGLLRLPLTALFCARECPGDAMLKAYDLAHELRQKETPVIGGFHTLMEKDVLEILLKGKGLVVICPARGLEGIRLSIGWNQTMQQGRFLLVSMFDQEIRRVTKETLHQRNLLVAGLANEHVFIHIQPGGETEKVSGPFSR